MRIKIKVFISVALIYCTLLSAGKYEGFYCDVFNDQGTGLNGPSKVPAIKYIGCTEEGIVIKDDKTLQSSIITENEHDANGVLLYPDGEPRFACIYSHGGYMGHSSDLGEEGRKRIKTHYYQGGSHVGSCAGSYMLSSNFNSYYCIWPGKIDMKEFNSGGDKTDADIPEDSPLLNYGYDFGGDRRVKGIMLNNGGSVLLNNDSIPVPEGTEILSLHDNVSKNAKMKGHGNCWGWKDNDTTGRIIGVSPHPEGYNSGEILDYMAALFCHSLAGLAPPDVKAPLVSGEKRVMDKETVDNEPAYTKIGDLQYHHFTVPVPDGGNDFSVSVTAEGNYDMHLFVAKDTFALKDNALFADSTKGPSKTISIPVLEPGTYYVGVKCATTVTSTLKTSGRDKYYEYSGNLDVLNGVKYEIEAEWGVTNIFAKNNSLNDINGLNIIRKNGSVIFNVNNADLYEIQVHNMMGRIVWNSQATKGYQQFSWTPESSGMFIVSLKSESFTSAKRIMITR